MFECLELFLAVLLLLPQDVPLVGLLLYDPRDDLLLHKHLLRLLRVLVAQILQLARVVRALLVELRFHFVWVARLESVIVLSTSYQFPELLNVLWYGHVSFLLSISSTSSIDFIDVFEIDSVVIYLELQKTFIC